MPKLLIDEHPLQVLPSLAVRIGLNEAIILQQIHYWLQDKLKRQEHIIEGKPWVYNSYEEWREQFPWWSAVTIRRTITRLESLGVLRSANFNRKKSDQTKWYTINYKILAHLEKETDQIDQPTRAKRPRQPGNLIDSLPEITAETTSETYHNGTPYNNGKATKPDHTVSSLYPPHDNDNQGECSPQEKEEDALTPLIAETIRYYYQQYREVFGRSHPRIAREQRERVAATLTEAYTDGEMCVNDAETVYALVDRHFARNPYSRDGRRRHDGNINAFANVEALHYLWCEAEREGSL